MNARWITLVAISLTLSGCGPTKPQQFTTPRPVSPPNSPSQSNANDAIDEPFVFYQMIQPGFARQLIDQVYLDTKTSRCFQSHRRSTGVVPFGRGDVLLDSNAGLAEIQHAVKVVKERSQKGAKPVIVLHGYADHDETDSSKTAQELSLSRAESVKAIMVESGVSAEQIRLDAHGWDLSLPPIVPIHALAPHRSVEISHDSAPPSESTLVQAQPVEQFNKLVAHIRQTTTTKPNRNSETNTDSVLATRAELTIHDEHGTQKVVLNLASRTQGQTESTEDKDHSDLHRFFLTGLASGCSFSTTGF